MPQLFISLHGYAFFLTAWAFVVSLSLFSGADAKEPTSGTVSNVAQLEIVPKIIILHGANLQQQLLVSGRKADGSVVDVTTQCKMTLADQGLARFINGRLLAIADGQTELSVELGDLKVNVPVTIAGSQHLPPVDFDSDIVPVLSKLGCNSGGCHGRVQGQNGFKLSVFGFDPHADYEAIVQEARGRRIFASSPARSLLLQKATANVPHGGGRRLTEDSVDYELVKRWIDQGLPPGNGQAPRLLKIEVVPPERLLTVKSQQQVLATAFYSDGSKRDVTHAAHYASNASSIAEVDSGGLIRSGNLPGEAAITVNYMGQVAAVRIQIPRARTESQDDNFQVNNRIDQLVLDKLKKMGLSASPLCSDEIFLRRLYLDVIGTLPTAAEVQEFLSDTDSTKRSKWIDRVLERPEYADYWALKWADILLVDKEKLGDRGAFEFHQWLRDQFLNNRPYDQWVRELITATGNSGRNGPVNLYRAADTPDALARTISQSFLGVRLECAQCHHHPFDQWSQKDFYGLAGFFNGLERKPLSTDRVLLVHTGYRPMTIPISNVPVETRPLGVTDRLDLTASDPRVVLADWLLKPDNPWFAKMFANRLWKQVLGRGLVEPEDDLRLTNPATNEPLLAYLTEQAVQVKFDQRAMLRTILNSRVYQTSSVPTDDNYEDEQNFSHYYVKRMPAEVMLDAICQVAGVPEEFPGQPRGTRAIQLWDNRLPSYFLEIFGRPPRNSPCECGRSSEPTMVQALHLANAPEVEAKIAHAEGRIASLLSDQKIDGSMKLSAEQQPAITDQLCLTALGRTANAKERKIASDFFHQGSAKQAAEDFMWTLVNSYDFLFIQ